MTIIRNGWHDVYPDEPPGVYAHVTDGSPCWCKPVILSNSCCTGPGPSARPRLWLRLQSGATQA